jgi:hypothetical protein
MRNVSKEGGQEGNLEVYYLFVLMALGIEFRVSCLLGKYSIT